MIQSAKQFPKWLNLLMVVSMTLALVLPSTVPVQAAPPARVLAAIPAPPTNLLANLVSSSRVDLTWTDNSTDESGFVIYRNGAEIERVSLNVTSYSDRSSLSCGQVYTYEVSAINIDGESGTAMDTVTTPVCPPPAPSDLETLAVGTNDITLGWTDNSALPDKQEEGFDVQRSPNGVNWVTVTTTAADVTSFMDAGLPCDTIYYYRIRAFNVSGESFSNVHMTATMSCTPTSPLNLTATPISQTQVDLAWSDVFGEEAYHVERGLTNIGPWTEIGTTLADVTTYSDLTVLCGTTYFYRVKARNAGGFSEPSNPVLVTTLGCLPKPPVSLNAVATSSTNILLTWQDKSDNETGFNIERSPDGLGGWTLLGTTPTAAANSTSYNNGSLTCGTPYYYRVQSVNAAGGSDYSNIAGAVTQPCPPTAPSNLVVTAVSADRVDLSWTDNSANEVLFKIERSPNGTNTWVEIATVGANVTTYSNLNLACATQYYYRVRAYNANGHSAYSNVDSDTTAACSAPLDPTGLTAATDSQTRIKLNWVDNSDNESGFKIERSPNGASGWVQIAAVGIDVATYTATGLTCDTDYYFRVRAYNAFGNSLYTPLEADPPVGATTAPCGPTPPNAPTNFALSVISKNEIKLTWGNVASETGYKVYRSLDNIAFTEVISLPVNTTSFSDINLDCGTKYYYFVRAFNDGGLSNPTATKYATTNTCNTMAVVKAGNTSANPGVTFTVPVTVSNIPAAKLGAVTVEIHFDPALLEVQSCGLDPDSKFNMDNCNIHYENDGVNPDVIRMSLTSSAGVSTSAKLANLSFKAKGDNGTSTIVDVVVIEFKDPDGNPVAATDKDGLVLIGKRGDVNGKDGANSVDALFILQYDVGKKMGSNVFPPPAGSIYLPACDVNLDGKCNVVDALFVLQCDVKIANSFCPNVSGAADVEALAAAPKGPGLVRTVNLAVPSGDEGVVPVSLKVPTGERVGAVSLKVLYDPTVVEPRTCQVDPEAKFDMEACNTAIPGEVSFNLTSTMGVGGLLRLADITFQALGEPGEFSLVTPVDVELSTVAGLEMQARTRESRLRVATPPAHKPVVLSVKKSGHMDMELFFTSSDFIKRFRGVQGSQLAKIKVLSLPAQGVLRLNGVDVVVNQKINVEDLNSLSYTPGVNWSGTDRFLWSGSDGVSFAPAETRVSVKIHATNKAPNLSTAVVRPVVDTPFTFTVDTFTKRFLDSDGDSLIRVRIASLPVHGVLTFDGTDVAVGQEIALLDLPKLVFTPEAGYTGSDLFTWNATDGLLFAKKDAKVRVYIK